MEKSNLELKKGNKLPSSRKATLPIISPIEPPPPRKIKKTSHSKITVNIDNPQSPPGGHLLEDELSQKFNDSSSRVFLKKERWPSS